MNPLVFIDTNIFLDFYRMKEGKIRLEFLAQLEKNVDSLILTEQVEIEFRKNRHYEIENLLFNIKSSSVEIFIPSIVSSTKPGKSLKKIKEEAKTQKAELLDTIVRLIDNPNKYDKLFMSINRIFSQKSEYCLGRDSLKKQDIRDRAIKRFQLGYPPKKEKDISIGDSLNWEWIIECASESKRDIIIVSRDGDFGLKYKENSYLNDWLKKEFHERIGKNVKITLTESLSFALKEINSEVSPEMEEAERKLFKGIIPELGFNRKMAESMLGLDNANIALAAQQIANHVNHINMAIPNAEKIANQLEAIRAQALGDEELIKLMNQRDALLGLVKDEK